mgnify:CR=1 FL=1
MSVKVVTWNVGSMSGRGTEMCEELRKRRMDVLSARSEVGRTRSAVYGIEA